MTGGFGLVEGAAEGHSVEGATLGKPALHPTSDRGMVAKLLDGSVSHSHGVIIMPMV